MEVRLKTLNFAEIVFVVLWERCVRAIISCKLEKSFHEKRHGWKMVHSSEIFCRFKQRRRTSWAFISFLDLYQKDFLG